ncbi:MAG: hypothetical protein JXR14_02475 [Paracoccaceae bacterium]
MLRASFISGVEKLSRTDPQLVSDTGTWDADPFLLGTPGKTIDLHTGLARDPSPRDFITRQTLVTPVEEAECPVWTQFLHETTGADVKFLRFIQQFCGYCLTGDTSEHALLFIHGPGGNGKSVFIGTLQRILHDYATTAPMETFVTSRSDRHPTELAMLRGARLVTASETDVNQSFALSKIKQLTGEDMISARFMRQDFFTFRPNFKLVMAGNHKPELGTVDNAIQRRFHLVPFDTKPVHVDRGLEAKLMGEAPSILRWMIEGCLDWQQNGLIPPAIVRETTLEYFETQDLFGEWLSSETILDPKSTALFSPSAQLYSSWSMFAKEAGEDPGSRKALASRLQTLGVRNIQRRLGNKPTRIWIGISLRNGGPGNV